MSCRYLGDVLSRQDISKTILRCLEDVLCRLGFCTVSLFKIFAKFTENTCAGISFLIKLQPEYFHYSRDFNNILA